MQIGGDDLIFSKMINPQGARDFVVGVIRHHWPDAIVDKDPDDSHWFIYRDPEAEKSWGRKGAHPTNEPFLIQAIVGDGELTLVPSSRDLPIVRAILFGLMVQSRFGPFEITDCLGRPVRLP